MSERTNEATKPEIPGRLKRKRIFGHANGDQEEKRARKGERERGVAKMERIKRSKRFRATSMNMHGGGRFRRLTGSWKDGVEQ